MKIDILHNFGPAYRITSKSDDPRRSYEVIDFIHGVYRNTKVTTHRKCVLIIIIIIMF